MNLSPQQEFIGVNCFHSSPAFTEFRKEEIYQSIPQRFEQIAARCPAQIAIKTRTGQLTYEELNRAANRLARAILDKRGETQEPVALIAEHGTSAIIAFLAILKSGKICMPLDPSWPRARLQYLFEDSQAGLVVSDAEAMGLTDDLLKNGLQRLNIDTDASLSSENVDVPLDPDRPATILYTSGSTGEPKGVLQNHRNLLFEVARLTNSFCISRFDRISHLLFNSVAGGVREIFSALLNGATLFPFNIKKDGIVDLAAWLIAEKITLCRFVSTSFRTLIGSLTGPQQFPDLRLIYMGGEAVYKKDFELYKRHFSTHCIFVNVYGATETGICLKYFAGMGSQIEGVNVPLGFPSEEFNVLLLDENGCEVQHGQIGEIAVESPYLALGYWRRAGLTAAAFSTDRPWTNSRIYRTGDLGRILDDGSIEYCGRKDFQAEIRGHRVEMAEVEKALLTLPSVKESVVVARDDMVGGQRLVAYVVPDVNCTPTVMALRRTLAERLPDYMVPAAFVFMDALPLTGIGKVDRLSLPSPDQSMSELGRTFMSPRTETQQTLVKIFAQLLGIAMIGIHDDFFGLGGNSLLAVVLVARIDTLFHKRLSPAIVYQAPTVERLANILSDEKWDESWSSLVPVQPEGSKPPFFWVHGDHSYSLLPHLLGSDQPIYGLVHQSQDGLSAHYTDVETIAAHYLEEIRTLQAKGPYLLGGFSFGGTVAFEIAQQLRRQGEEVALLFMLDSHFPGHDILDHPPEESSDTFPVHDQLHRALHNLASIPGFQKKLTYVSAGAWERINNSRAMSIRNTFKKVVCKFHLTMGRPIPLSLRSFYILGIYRQALRKYVPQRYDGPMLYVKSETRSREHQIRWSRQITGEMDVLEVPGDHMELVKEPYVQAWAEKLKSALENARDGSMSE